MIDPGLKSVRLYRPEGFVTMAYAHWPAHTPTRPPVVCVHGLSRQGREFDWLADRLRRDRDVLCPDIVGRGRSDWLPDPAGYAVPDYVRDLSALLAGLGPVDWVGTSMGGIIGMVVAATPGNPIRRLVLNDIGAWVPAAGLARIGDSLGSARFATRRRMIEDLAARLGSGDPPGPVDLEHLAEHAALQDPDGTWRYAYDPNIAVPFNQIPGDIDLWSVWDRITCPTLILRGERSDILTASVADRMAQMRASARVVAIPGCGHAPALIDGAQIGLVEDFLGGG